LNELIIVTKLQMSQLSDSSEMHCKRL